jgi:hypothetical protein
MELIKLLSRHNYVRLQLSAFYRQFWKATFNFRRILKVARRSVLTPGHS